MAIDNEVVTKYFSSINPMARKIMKDQQNLQKLYGHSWKDLKYSEQEEILDDHFIGSVCQDKCRHVDQENIPESFPKLKIRSGEKIVVEDDLFSWQDEHSGPFSWKSKSQQDLSLEGLDDVIKNHQKRQSRYSTSLESSVKENVKRSEGSQWKPEKSIWANRFLAADRGYEVENEDKEGAAADRGYEVENEDKEGASDGKEEDILKQYGITFSMSSDNADLENYPLGGSSGRQDVEYSPCRASLQSSTSQKEITDSSRDNIQDSIRSLSRSSSRQSSFGERSSYFRTSQSRSRTQSYHNTSSSRSNTQSPVLGDQLTHSHSRQSLRSRTQSPPFQRQSSVRRSMQSPPSFQRQSVSRTSLQSPSRHNTSYPNRTSGSQLQSAQGSIQSIQSHNQVNSGELLRSPSRWSRTSYTGQRSHSRQSSMSPENDRLTRSRSGSVRSDAFSRNSLRSSGRQLQSPTGTTNMEGTSTLSRSGFDFLDDW